MRTITTEAVPKIAQQFGGEPICLVGIKWVYGSDYSFYADKALNGVDAKVLSIANIEDVLSLQGSGSATNISVTLDDTDGTIKTIFDNNDIHRRPCAIFQTFEGITNPFVLYEGLIESPIVWNEGDRTITFNLVSISEHIEIGFAPEEGQFPNLPTADVGVVWPLAFGNPLKYPGLTYQVIPVGTTLNPFYVVDESLDIVDPSSLGLPGAVTFSAQSIYFDGNQPTDTGDALNDAINTTINDLADELDSRPPPGTISFMIDGQEYDAHDYELVRTQAAGSIPAIPTSNQSGYITLPEVRAELQLKKASTVGVQLLNKGYGFPVGQALVLSMGGHVFHGKMDANGFMTLKEWKLPKATFAYSPPQALLQPGESPTEHNFQVQQAATYFTPDGSFTPDEYKKKGTPKFGPGGQAPIGYKLVVGLVSDGFQLYDAGSTITILGDWSLDYIVNTIPTTVTQVYGFRSIGNVKTLTAVPRSRWTHVSVDFNGITAEIVRINRPLPGYPGEGWESGIYVDQISSVGHNPADIMLFAINTYAPDLSGDPASFNLIRDFLVKYPMNFVYLQRTDIVSFLGEIAYQARCALWVKDFVVYTKYLPYEEPYQDTITEADIIEGTLEVTCTDTEQLVTRAVGTYVSDLSIGVQNDVVVRSNITKYGVFRDSHDYFTYDEGKYVMKSVTYWSIIKSNIWKRIKFSTPLHKIYLETFDSIRLNFTHPYVAYGAVTARIERSSYDSVKNQMDFECWVPVRLGEMFQYEFAYPQNISATLFYPTVLLDYSGTPYRDFRQFVSGILAVQPNQQSSGGGGSGGGGGSANDNRVTTDLGSQYPSDQADPFPTARFSDDSPLPDPVQFPTIDPGTIPDSLQKQQIHTLQTPPAGMVPGQIQSGKGAVYNVTIYLNGLDHKGLSVQVKQLQIDAAEQIPNGTWVMVSRITLARQASGSGAALNFTWSHIHYMQVPIWLA